MHRTSAGGTAQRMPLARSSAETRRPWRGAEQTR
jgi:hypothetical protein